MGKNGNSSKSHKTITAALALLLVVCIGAGLFVQYGTDLFFTSEEETELLIPEEEVAEETVVVRPEKDDENLYRPQGDPGVYEILEIVPGPEFSFFKQIIGGMEPYPGALRWLANAGGGSHIMSKDQYGSTPFYIVENGVKKEYLGDPKNQKASDYAGKVGEKKSGLYEVMTYPEEITGQGTGTLKPGHFEYIGGGNGIYALTKKNGSVPDLTEEWVPVENGRYVPVYVTTKEGQKTYYEFYNQSRIDKGGWIDTTKLSGAFFDAVFEYWKKRTQDTWENGYFVTSVAPDNKNGEYVLDEENTAALLGADATSFDEKLAKEMNKAASQRKIVYRRFDPDRDTGDGVLRYNLTFDYGQGAVDYGIVDFTVNPEGGKFQALLTGDLYQLAPDGETGQFEKRITKFTMEAMAITGAEKGEWVWIPGAPEDPGIYTTQDEYKDGKGSLWSPNFSDNVVHVKEDGKTVCKRGYYCMNDFRNNEWFKLRCIPTGYTYDTKKTVEENMAAADSAIKNFEKNEKIHVTTVRPEEVTTAMIERAEVIYFGNTDPLNDLFPALVGHGDIATAPAEKYDSDLKEFSMVRDLYDYCMSKEKAIMLNVSVGDQGATTNIGKLYMLLSTYEDPRTMRMFFNDYPGFNKIDQNGNMIHNTTVANSNNVYYTLESEERFKESCKGKTPAQVESAREKRYHINTKPLEQRRKEDWTRGDFLVVDGEKLADGSSVNTDIGGEFSLNWGHFDGTHKPDQVVDNERYLIFQWCGQNFLQDFTNMPVIQKILRRDEFNVTVTNAVMNSKWEDVIYVDEFDEKYNIYYLITAFNTLYKLPEVEKVEIFVDDIDASGIQNGKLDPGIDFIDSGDPENGYVGKGNGRLDKNEPTMPYIEICASGVAQNPNVKGYSAVDPNGASLNFREDVEFYPGYAIDVKDQMGGKRERNFFIRVVGKQERGKVDRNTGKPIPETVTAQTAVTVIIRDMFELN